jgi:hypothetical protein
MPREVKGLETSQIGDEIEVQKAFEQDGATIKKVNAGRW